MGGCTGKGFLISPSDLDTTEWWYVAKAMGGGVALISCGCGWELLGGCTW